MNKSQIIQIFAKEAGIPPKLSKDLVENFTQRITEKLINGEKVYLTGFGTFEVREQGPRKVILPKTGEIIQLPKRAVIRFRPSSHLKNQVKKGGII